MTKLSNRDRALKTTTTEFVYRSKTQSGDTWAMILANPLKSFHEYVEMGGRANTIADAIRRGFLAYASDVSVEQAKANTVKRLAEELAEAFDEYVKPAKDADEDAVMIKCRDKDEFNAYAVLQAHALENYEQGGWDMIYECWGREEVRDHVAGKRFASKSAFLKSVGSIAKAYDEQRQEAKA